MEEVAAAMRSTARGRMACLCILAALTALARLGGSPPGLEAQESARDRFGRAEALLGIHTRGLVVGGAAVPNWLDDDRFWYRSPVLGGEEYILVDARTGERTPLLDAERLAGAMDRWYSGELQPLRLPLDGLRVSSGVDSIFFRPGASALGGVDGEGVYMRPGYESLPLWVCELGGYTCLEPAGPGPRPVTHAASPDGRWEVFVQEHDLWLRNAISGEERRLTDDGEEFFAYGAHPEGCCVVVTDRRAGVTRRPIVSWSPDSRYVATWKVDLRNVEPIHLIETRVGRPILHTWRYALPGDSVVPRSEIHLFEAESGAGVRADLPLQDWAYPACCSVMRDTTWMEIQWGPDSGSLFYGRLTRGFQRVDLMSVDPRSGAVHQILSEQNETFIDLHPGFGVPNWRVLPGEEQVIWYSQRDGWGHLYLHDVGTGEEVRALTRGEWAVVDLVHVDAAGGWVYFTATGREEGRDLYHRHLYRTAMDGSGTTLLTPEAGDHEVWFSPGGTRFVQRTSTPLEPPVIRLRTADGGPGLELQRADPSALYAAGWTPPTPFWAPGRDGATPLYGHLFLPGDFRDDRRYPVVVYHYPGPQVGSVGTRQFNPGPPGNARALAELGFAVVALDVMGTPFRSKAFHDRTYGNLADNGLPDIVAVLGELGRRHPQLDLDRVGIYGHSGGGRAVLDAMLDYPEFFKVGVSTGGSHDNRSYHYFWGEKYQGLLRATPSGGDSYEVQASQLRADRLQGKLLLAWGTLDDNGPPNLVHLVIDELIRHDKDFDAIPLINRNHSLPSDPYLLRRTWDYFVRHLLEDPTSTEHRSGGAAH